MIRSQVLYNHKTGMLSVTPCWPPTPSEGDHWVKPAREGSRQKHLERKVLKIRGWRVTFEDQDGKTKTVHADVFQRWTDDCRAVPKKLRQYIILRPDKDSGEIYKLRKKKRPPKHHKDAYVWHRRKAPTA